MRFSVQSIPLRSATALLIKLVLGLGVLSIGIQVKALDISGVWSQGGLLVGRVAPEDSVVFMGRQVRLSNDGVFVIGLGRDAPAEAVVTVTSALGEQQHRFSVAQRSYREEIIEGVPQRTVTPPQEVLARIRKEAAMVKQARTNDTDIRHFLAGFTLPAQGRISGVYGSRRVYNGTPGRPHFGLDIAAPTGTPVYAPASGEVRLTHEDMYYSGGTLIIDHGHGVSSTFIHLSEVLVSPGDIVTQGDLIARIGSSGRATGPHLDWRINWFDVRLDPALVLEQFPSDGPP